MHTSRLKDLREEAGLTQRALAERAGVAALTIINAEKGRHQPQAPTMKKIADALGVTVRELRRAEPTSPRVLVGGQVVPEGMVAFLVNQQR